MKRFIILAIALFASLSLPAKEIDCNPQTNLSLDETAGVYSLRCNTGILVLGDIKTARDFLFSADVCFTKQKLNEVIACGEKKFEVKTDDTGMYIVQMGVGVVKIRPGDATRFLTLLEGRIVKDKAKKIWKVIKD